MLPRYNNILVPTDFTPNSDHAFKHAVVIARQSDAKIHLLHVMPEIDSSMRSYLSPALGEGKLEELEQKHVEEARVIMEKNLTDFAKTELAKFPEDLARFAGVEVVIGHPVIKILEVADKLDADLIVLGTRGKGVLEHALLGSVTEKVLKKSTRPVFVVPLPK